MATLSDLRDRIIRETNRDELLDAPSSDNLIDANSDTLDLCIQNAIRYYSDNRFSFNEATATIPLTTGVNTATYPTGFRQIDRLSVAIGNNRYGLRKQDWTVIDQWTGYGTANGQPTDYSVSDDVITLYPTPSSDYVLTAIGISDVSPALIYTDGSSENAWTNEGQDVIAARARFLLLRDYFRDMEGASIAAQAEDDAVRSLRGETAKKIASGRVRGAW